MKSNCFNQLLQWRDNVDNGSMMLRDIIDLETTYARLNEDDIIVKIYKSKC